MHSAWVGPGLCAARGARGGLSQRRRVAAGRRRAEGGRGYGRSLGYEALCMRDAPPSPPAVAPLPTAASRTPPPLSSSFIVRRRCPHVLRSPSAAPTAVLAHSLLRVLDHLLFGQVSSSSPLHSRCSSHLRCDTLLLPSPPRLLTAARQTFAHLVFLSELARLSVNAPIRPMPVTTSHTGSIGVLKRTGAWTGWANAISSAPSAVREQNTTPA